MERSFGHWLRQLWRWSWVVTLPVTAVFVLWTVRVADRYRDFGLRYQTYNDSVDLHRIGSMEASFLARKAELALTPGRSEAQGLRRIELFVSEANEARLNAELPHSGREYVGAALLYPDGRIREVSMRYRGDFYWHWAGIKKSIRVKTKKKTLFGRMRSFNLLAPKTPNKLNEHLGYVLAREMGLIAPASELVSVSINGENRGVYVLVEQIEELVLRKNDRMPGDIFAGELVARDRYRGISGRLFENPGLWEKSAVDNHLPPEARNSLELLCELLRAEPSEEQAAALRELLDLEAFGRFAAYRLLVQSLHYDDTHNWRLYYDPWRNVFEPIVWDPAAWAADWLPRHGEGVRTDIASSTLDRVLQRDNQFMLARHRALEEYFALHVHERFVLEIDELIERMEEPLRRDPALQTRLRYERPDQVLARMHRLRKKIVAVADELRTAYLSGRGGLRYARGPKQPGEQPVRIRLEVEGRRPFERVVLAFQHPLDRAPEARLAWWVGAERREVDVTDAIVRRGVRIELDRPLMAHLEPLPTPQRRGQQAEVTDQSPSMGLFPASYELTLSGVSLDDNALLEVHGIRGDGSTVNAERRETLGTHAFSTTVGVVLPAPRALPEVWSGTLAFAGVRTIRSDVVVEPGTTLFMEPGASLILEGRLTARGTAERPIRIVPAAADQEPWGVLALRGPGARGSVLAHCEFAGGSGYATPLAVYSAMLSIHDVPGVHVRDCTFRDSRVVDDMVHAVYSEVRFEDCLFERSLLDAIDLDLCEAVIERCEFVDSGNDALDLMTSTVVVKDCTMRGSADKGISVGEDTRVLVINSRLVKNAIGVQTKDRSTAVLYNVDLVDNGTAVDAYKKNWRYDSGGFAYLYKSHVAGNGATFTTDPHSGIRVFDCYLDAEVESEARILLAHVDALEPRESRSTGDFRFPEESHASVDFFDHYWGYTDPGRRGVRGVDETEEPR
ncbi:MAG: CotH kinase family protein [Planctomycetota bacterium]|nr:CotH kinase family protein [Planctomycetota bacterium]